MLLINCEINLILTWSSTCVITNSTGAGYFTIADTQCYVPGGSRSTQHNVKLLQQLKSYFIRKKVSIQIPNQYLDYLVDSSFRGVNRLFSCYRLKTRTIEKNTSDIIFQK